jgi:hypothetical protein
MVPSNPYPNIATSYNPKIIGFRNPMIHSEPLAARCMSHLAHNPSNLWSEQRELLRITKHQARDHTQAPEGESDPQELAD